MTPSYTSGFLWDAVAVTDVRAVDKFPNITRGVPAVGYAREGAAKIVAGHGIGVLEAVWMVRWRHS